MKTFTPSSSKNSLPSIWRFIIILGNTRTTRHNYWSSYLSFGRINIPLLLPLEFLLWRCEASSSR